MNKKSLLHAFGAILGLCLLVALSTSLQAADKKKVTWTNKYGPVIQRSVVQPGDKPGHELSLQTRSDTTSSADPDWDGAVFQGMGIADLVDGSGTISGYGTRTHKNGDKTFVKYQGTLKTSGTGDARQSIAEGTMEFIGGTGKFANIKGSGKFTSKSGPAGGSSTVDAEVEY